MTKRARGFSLLEVVIASIIFVITLGLLVGLWASYHSALTQSRTRLVANNLARAVMEEKMAGGHASLTANLGTPEVQTVQARAQVRGRNSVMNFETTFLATDPGGPNSALRRLTVTVVWQEDSMDKTLTYESCLFNTQ